MSKSIMKLTALDGLTFKEKGKLTYIAAYEIDGKLPDLGFGTIDINYEI